MTNCSSKLAMLHHQRNFRRMRYSSIIVTYLYTQYAISPDRDIEFYIESIVSGIIEAVLFSGHSLYTIIYDMQNIILCLFNGKNKSVRLKTKSVKLMSKRQISDLKVEILHMKSRYNQGV